MDRSRICWTVLIVAYATSIAAVYFLLTPLKELFRVSDFENYWLLTQQFLAKENPYDFEKLVAASVHGNVGPAHFGPWVYILFLPILSWSFETSLFIYFVVNITAWCGLGVVAANLFAPRKLALSEAALSSLLFTPAFLTFFYGQWSIIVAIFGYLALFAWKRGLYPLCGAMLACATIKPHLGFLVWAALVVLAVIQRRWSVLGAGAITLGVLTGTSELLFPGITSNWLNAFSSSLGWKTASLIMPIRLAFATPADPYPAIPAIVIPLIILWGVCTFFSKKDEFSLLPASPYLFALSCLFAPYIWPFDYTVMIGLHFAIFHSATAEDEQRTSLNRVLLLIFSCVFFLHFFSENQTLALSTYWYPIALLYLYARTRSDSVAR
ncbi:MAG: DUF2029 domain-containing protein [Bdellovibrionales bacterium]|nr:DUF2029 domain-containing protein [Bdellovibrionales bacterium]